jgi:nucleotide-binding universal stress UspA family protein
MYTRIVVPLDGSESAELALDRARVLSREHEAAIHLVRIVDIAGTHDYSTFLTMERAGLSGAQDTEESQASGYLEAVRLQLRDEGFEASWTAPKGRAVQQIVNLVHSGDLVVMTTHGKGRAPRWFLGRVADEVHRRCRVPVELVSAAAPQLENLPLPGIEVDSVQA